MKKVYTLVLGAFILPGFMCAQVVISDIQPEFGDQFTVHQTSTEMDPGASGANVIWDFSVMDTEYIVDYVVINPEGAGGSEFFSESTMCWRMAIAGVNVVYAYYSFDDGTMIEYGHYSESEGTIVENINTDPINLFKFPINYQDTESSTYAGSMSIVDLMEWDFEGTRSYVVDAYGSITTPLGSFENALRVKVSTVSTTSMGLIETHNTEYIWFVPEYPYPIFVISIDESYYLGQFLDVEYYSTYLSAYSVASGIADRSVPTLNLYPNPAQSQITVQSDFEGQAMLHIYTLDGRKVGQHTVRNSETINVSNYTPGLYIAELHSKGSVHSRVRFVVSK